MKYIFGIDGGGSGCRVALASTKGKLLSTAKSGPANIETSLVDSRNNIIEACRSALEKVSLDESILRSTKAVLGLAGSNMGDYDKQLKRLLPFEENIIVNDGEIALEGAIGYTDGCIGAIGTGSVFVGRTNGQAKQIGGWGFLFGDDGSGAKLGKELLRLSILCEEKYFEHSNLTKRIMNNFNNKIVNIAKIGSDLKPKDFASYAPLVFEFYHQKDPNAIKIINNEIKMIELSLNAVGFNAQLPFCLVGGLGSSYLPLLNKKFSNVAQPPINEPLIGAVKMAQRIFN